MSELAVLPYVTVLVADQDDALGFSTDRLGFAVREDDELPGGDRWLAIGLPGTDAPALTLVPADTQEKRDLVNRQAADHVLFVVETDDCRETFETYVDRGVTFAREPEAVPWGVHATFEDRYGNLFDVDEPRER